MASMQPGFHAELEWLPAASGDRLALRGHGPLYPHAVCATPGFPLPSLCCGSRLYRQTPHCDPLGPVLPANALCRTLRRELQMSTITTGTTDRLTTPLIRESHGHRPASCE